MPMLHLHRVPSEFRRYSDIKCTDASMQHDEGLCPTQNAHACCMIPVTRRDKVLLVHQIPCILVERSIYSCLNMPQPLYSYIYLGAWHSLASPVKYIFFISINCSTVKLKIFIKVLNKTVPHGRHKS